MAGRALRALQVEPVEIHHLDPGFDEVVHELRRCIVGGIDFGDRSQLRAGTEDQVDRAGGPFDLAGLAVVANDPVEQRRADRRRDMEILRLASLESAIHITEYIAGRLPSWKKEAIEKLRSPVADLANLNRSIIQITLAEDRFDETSEERLKRIRSEAEAEVRAEREAAAARLQAEPTLRRAENKQQVQDTVRAVTLYSLRLPFSDREKILGSLFRELEQKDGAAYDGDPVEIAADLCLRISIATKGIDPKHIIQPHANLAAMARAHLEALRGEHPVEDDDAPDNGVVSFARAKAQGPPN